MAAPPRQEREQLVNFGGRIRESTRRRARMYAAANDLDLQEIIDQALVEFLDRQGLINASDNEEGGREAGSV